MRLNFFIRFRAIKNVSRINPDSEAYRDLAKCPVACYDIIIVTETCSGVHTIDFLFTNNDVSYIPFSHLCGE